MKVISKICKARDVLTCGNDNKIMAYSYSLLLLTEDLRTVLNSKMKDYKYEMDFTAQDLREMAVEIREVIHRWEDLLAGENQIKWLLTQVEEGKLNMYNFTEKICPYLKARHRLMILLNVCDFFSAALYMLEEASVDEFALKHTDRIKQEKHMETSLEQAFAQV